MSKEYAAPVVPQELESGLTPEVLAIHEEFASYSLAEYLWTIPAGHRAERIRDTGDANVVILGDTANHDGNLHVLGLSHQQAWKPSMGIRSDIYHRINNPTGLTAVLPNNSVYNRAYNFSDAELEALNSGMMMPFYERQARAVERIADMHGLDGEVVLAGASLAGLTALGIAAVGSDRLDIREVHSLDAPNKESTPKQLTKDFMASAKPLDQVHAIKDAALPVLSQALSPERLILDYVRFGAAKMLNKNNKALINGMATPDYEVLTQKALAQYDRVRIYAGHIAGSTLFDPEVVADITDPRHNVWSIAEGPGSHRHGTIDNPFAHALALAA